MPEVRAELLPSRIEQASHWMPAPSMDNRMLVGIEAIVEPIASVASLWFLIWWFGDDLGLAWLVVSVLVFALGFPGRRQLHLSPRSVVIGTLVMWLWTSGLLLTMGFASGRMDNFDPVVVGHWLWFAPTVQLAAHWALRGAAPKLARLQGQVQRAVIVGTNEQGWLLAQRLANAPDSAIELMGIFGAHPAPEGLAARCPTLGKTTDVAAYVKEHRVERVYLSVPMTASSRTTRLLDSLKDTTASVYFVPDMFVTDMIQGRADKVCGLPVVSVCDTPFRGPAGVIKRISDLVLASLILLLISPVMIGVALAVKLSSPGPVIFRQRRYGLNGQEIIVYKFRSMTVTEDGPAIAQARKNDSRVTRVGAFLRRTSLDELPQFINVLQGRMSVVGPRPHAIAHNEMYRRLVKSYMVRHKVRPGITGWAQVNGFRGETESIEKMEARVRCDLDYLRNWSLRLDIYIILRTIRLVFRDGAAY
jgi:putative colanic acid biosysnthesis UDP-glucose lipid carrier transferase